MSFENLNDAYPWLVGTLTLCVAVLVGYVVHLGIITVATRLARRTPTPVDEALIANVRRPVGLFLPTGAALLALPFITLPEAVLPSVRHGLIILLIAATGWGVLGLLRAIGDILLARFKIDHSNNLEAREVRTRVLLFNRIAVVVVVILTFALILMTFPNIRHLGVSLFASAGVAGIVIGLAARPTIANLIAGLQIALSQPIRVDDVVIVEGEWGWIEEITMTYVVIRIWDQRRLIVPLSNFIEKPFQNWTRKTADIIGTVFLHADYTVPVGKIREELKRLVKDHPKWDGKVCVLQVTNATERTVELRALVSARNSPDAWDLRCDIREGLILFLQHQYPECLPRVRADVGNAESPAVPAVI
ncbi:MAG: mechanosensitive ion channel family protein [Gammaproteobacteria bacterium]|nr:mechanosensitive ion channel family protein [Gammaproteobacteria bacterium]